MISKKDLPEKGKIFMILKAPTDKQILCSDGTFMSHEEFQLSRDTGKLREIQKPSITENGIYEEVEMSDEELEQWLITRKRAVERAQDNVIRHYQRLRERNIEPSTVEISELNDLAHEVARANHVVNTLLSRYTTQKNIIKKSLMFSDEYSQDDISFLSAKIGSLTADSVFINAKPKLSYVTRNLPSAAPRTRKSGRDRKVNRHFGFREVMV